MLIPTLTVLERPPTRFLRTTWLASSRTQPPSEASMTAKATWFWPARDCEYILTTSFLTATRRLVEV